MRKIIFFDIDGTISSIETGEIPESAVRAIRKARENGHIAVINTGRTAFSVQKKYRNIGFDGYIYGCGTRVEADGKDIYHSNLSKEKCREIMKKAREAQVTAVYENSEAVFFDRTLPKHEIIDKLVKRFGLHSKNVPDVIDGNEILFDKFCVWVNEDEDFFKFYELIEDDFDYACHGNHMYEMMPKGVSKATGIQAIMEYYQVPLENCYAIGDSNNDLAMLKFVPNSIAMGNAMEEILPYCTYQTASVEDDGVEKALQHYGII